VNDEFEPKNEIERLLEEAVPLGAPRELRNRVLNSVNEELANRTVWSLERRLGGLVAAAVFIGFALNILAARRNDHHLAELAGPPLPRAATETIDIARSIAGDQTAEWLRRQLVSAWSARPKPTLDGPTSYLSPYSDIRPDRETSDSVPMPQNDQTETSEGTRS
jgi:hypothetical protein